MTAAASTEATPKWILDDLYLAQDDPKISEDLDRTAESAKSFAAQYQGKLAALDGAGLGRAIKEYEELSEVLSAVMSYAQLLFAADAENAQVAAFYQDMNERATEISTDTLFFELELNRIEDATLAQQMTDPTAVKYAPWVDSVRIYKPYQLDDELEKLLHEKSVTGRASWSRLFDETMAGMRFDVDGRKISSSEIMSRMSDADGLVRKKAAKAFGKGLNENIKLFSLVTNTLAKDKEIEDGWRKFPRPVSSRNLSNQVEDEVVDALASAVKDNYANLAHRYYKLKAKWMGVEEMDYWDRNAPLPDADEAKISWGEAKETVLSSYNAFEPQLSEIAEQFFDKSWIDADPREGKDSGAFSHPTVPSAHPYILMNYHGKTRDVMTLAHELGHGVHQVLAAPHGHFLSDTPLTLAETASVFGEMLTFRGMLDGAEDDKTRRILLAGKVEDMLNTVVRQIAFYSFEERVHAERQNGELSADRLGEIWMDIQTESLGPAFKFDEEYRHFWAYIPHFIHSPFYVYAYAFGDCLVNSLYDVFQEGHPGFRDKYIEMLKAGGTLRHKELLAPFGLDASDPAFWHRGLSVVAGFVDELEQISKE
ncbi:MAG: M3 family oligoendopeptidase [Rhodospirillaceae bacterium]|jgi:oligoendopeptidase F|nr:M3 family oligoendopeptidase [Rhodospirillaceae bacterium]MBT4589335.1 M3 family oligoendopeptidase [Rhodospirillaceae bacterium]MBT5940333.1 M3 family oligoendopeptidase [Rhodospirillaceae bacterium]